MAAYASEIEMPDTAKDAKFWNKTARKYATDPVADVAGYERTLEQTRRYLKASDSVFEFGCGTGTTALKLAPSVAHILATDISTEMIAIAREKAHAENLGNVTFEVSTPAAAPQPDASFDAALGFNILHLVQRDAALRSVHRLLKPGGLFISKTPCLKEMNPMIGLAVPLMRMVGAAPYVATFNASELKHSITAQGFEIVECDRHGSNTKDPRIFLVARKL